MSILHAYSQTVADGTATSVVRPSDWNSAHNMVLNVAGNTLGTSQISGSDIVWAGGNNITLSANGSTVTVVGPNTVAQTVQTQASGNIVGAGFTSTTTAGTAVVATQNSAGLSMGVPAYLTTAAQSNHSHNFATTTTGGSNIVVGTANSAGATIGVPAFITTYAGQTTQTQPAGNIAGVGTTYAGTDIAATIGLNSNGLALSLSQSAGTDVWVATGANTIAGTNTTGSWTHDSYVVSGAGIASVGVTGGTLIVSVPAGGGAGFAAGVSTDANGTTGTVSNQVVFFEGNTNITLSQSINGNSASISILGAAGGGGGGYTYTRWPSPGQNISSLTSAALTAYNGSLIIGAELAGVNISGTGVALVMGHSVQSSYNTLQNGSLSLRVGIYSRNNDTQLTLLSSSSTSFAMSWSSSTTTGVQGMRELYVPMNVNMPVGEYFIARNMSYTGDNASAATAHTVSFFGVPMQTNVSNVADGFGIATNASNAAFIPFQGVYSTTTNAMPNSIGLTQVTMSGSAVVAGNFFREYH